jgi:DNA-binding transcriptional LysR family regulator
VSVNIRAAFTPRDVIDMVRTGAAELGLLATSGPLADKAVISRVAGEQRFVLVTPTDGPFPGGRSVACEELAGQRLIVGQRGTGMRAYVDGLRERGIGFTIAAETEHRVAILPLVLAGVGLAVVTESWRTMAERAGALVLDIEPKSTLQIALVSRRAEQSPAAEAFLTCAFPATEG